MFKSHIYPQKHEINTKVTLNNKIADNIREHHDKTKSKSKVKEQEQRAKAGAKKTSGPVLRVPRPETRLTVYRAA